MSGKDVPSRLLIVAPDTAVKGSHPQVKSELSVIQVFHPRHESCILLQQEGKFFEIQKSQLGKYASWFINQQVNSSKHIYLGSPVDPRFLLLPYFEAAGSRFSPLEQIVHSSTIAIKGDGVRILPLTHWKQWRMEEVFDVNDKLGDDMILFRYNKDKTLAWLQGKVNKVALVLAKQRRLLEQRSQSLFAPSFRSGSAAPSHATNTPTDIAVDRHDTKLAVEIVCDNLSDTLVAELVAAVGFTVAEIMVTKAPTSSLKRKADWEVALEQEQEELAHAELMKSSKTSQKGSSQTGTDRTAPPPSAPTRPNGDGLVDYSAYLKGDSANAPPPAAKVTKTATLNAAAAKGTKSISSFFGAKK